MLQDFGQLLSHKLLGDIQATKYIPPWPDHLMKLLRGEVHWKNRYCK